MKLTAHLRLGPRSRIVTLYLHSFKHLHGILLIQLSTGASPFSLCNFLHVPVLSPTK
jgi:hypothetical protein